ncbi:MAG: hypothetical protein JWR69_4773 [Pedosphaera sp.]|nr:hypothetical protein [Pedosphaera sp.]
MKLGPYPPYFRAWLLLLAACVPYAAVFAQSTYVNFECKQTSPVRLSTDGRRLFAVNTPDARLSVFDVTHPSNPALLAEIPVGVEPVSVNPRTSDEVWVVNEVSDSISIVSVSQRSVTDTLYVPDEPADVVFAGGRAFVTAARKNMIVVFDVISHARLASIPVSGVNPRALAASIDGTKVYAAFALSGNHTTIIPESIAPAQAKPTNPSLPTPPKAGLIVEASDPAWANVIKYQMPENDVVEIDVASLSVTRYFTNLGTINLGIAVRPDNGDLYVANTDARNLVHFEPVLRGHVVDNRITEITIGTGARTFYDLNPGTDYGILPNRTAMTNALAQPTAIVFDPSGNFFYVAAFGTDRIASVDKNGNILARIDVGNAAGSVADPRHKRGPRGLALNAGAQRLYAFNRIANSITIIDTAGLAVLAEIPVGSFDPTPAVIRNGRGFLYDAKLSGNGTISCATCHVDAEMDLLAWDLGDPSGVTTPVTLSVTNGTGTNVPATFVVQSHPMKGPLTTQTLRGLQGSEPFHWRGEKTNFLAFASTFNTLLGAATNLTEVDQAAFRDFINTLTFEPNPNQNLDRTYPTNFAGGNAVAGLQSFQTQPIANCGLCIVCHRVPPGSGSFNFIVPNNEEGGLPQNFKRPQLRDLYQRLDMSTNAGAMSMTGFGLMHDGEQPSLISFLSRPFFGTIPGDVKTNLSAFLQCFDNGTAPAVGYTRTVNASNVGTAGILNDWSLLENQAAVSNVDLVVKGTLDGKLHGLLYRPASTDYLVDSTNSAPFTRAQLQAKILAGDSLSLTGVPPGSGARMAIDRDLDGVLDGDVALPALQAVASGGNLVLSWPYSAAGYVLESSPTLSSTSIWTTVAAPLVIVGSQNLLTNNPTSTARFYRLRLDY